MGEEAILFKNLSERWRCRDCARSKISMNDLNDKKGRVSALKRLNRARERKNADVFPSQRGATSQYTLMAFLAKVRC